MWDDVGWCAIVRDGVGYWGLVRDSEGWLVLERHHPHTHTHTHTWLWKSNILPPTKLYDFGKLRASPHSFWFWVSEVIWGHLGQNSTRVKPCIFYIFGKLIPCTPRINFDVGGQRSFEVNFQFSTRDNSCILCVYVFVESSSNNANNANSMHW